VDQQRAAAAAFLGQNSRRGGIDGTGQIRLGFRLVHGGVGGGVDHDVGGKRAHGLAQRVGVRQVELASIQGMQLAQAGQRALQFAAELSGAAGEQDIHAKVSASANGIPAASFAASRASPLRGQGIASRGSFHSSVRSCAGLQ
jgi:hypothetical protein